MLGFTELIGNADLTVMDTPRSPAARFFDRKLRAVAIILSLLISATIAIRIQAPFGEYLKAGIPLYFFAGIAGSMLSNLLITWLSSFLLACLVRLFTVNWSFAWTMLYTTVILFSLFIWYGDHLYHSDAK